MRNAYNPRARKMPHSRNKGNRGELEAAKRFAEYGFSCWRTPNSGGLELKGDLQGELPIHVEVKRQESLRIWDWIKQAKADAGDKPWALVFRRNHSRWHVVVDLDHYLELLATARDADMR